ncbi:hypothetical protein J6590_079260 [Homalodisca vitripennis]|nr:hypothetical protein J6590_079260 [Homalodisca vitripennis]
MDTRVQVQQQRRKRELRERILQERRADNTVHDGYHVTFQLRENTTVERRRRPLSNRFFVTGLNTLALNPAFIALRIAEFQVFWKRGALYLKAPHTMPLHCLQKDNQGTADSDPRANGGRCQLFSSSAYCQLCSRLRKL